MEYETDARPSPLRWWWSRVNLLAGTAQTVGADDCEGSVKGQPDSYFGSWKNDRTRTGRSSGDGGKTPEDERRSECRPSRADKRSTPCALSRADKSPGHWEAPRGHETYRTISPRKYRAILHWQRSDMATDSFTEQILEVEDCANTEVGNDVS